MRHPENRNGPAKYRPRRGPRFSMAHKIKTKCKFFAKFRRNLPSVACQWRINAISARTRASRRICRRGALFASHTDHAPEAAHVRDEWFGGSSGGRISLRRRGSLERRHVSVSQPCFLSCFGGISSSGGARMEIGRNYATTEARKILEIKNTDGAVRAATPPTPICAAPRLATIPQNCARCGPRILRAP